MTAQIIIFSPSRFANHEHPQACTTCNRALPGGEKHVQGGDIRLCHVCIQAMKNLKDTADLPNQPTVA